MGARCERVVILRQLPLFVVPAQAGTSNPCLSILSIAETFLARGPRLRGDDNGLGVSQ